jgi:hypothetical protein
MEKTAVILYLKIQKARMPIEVGWQRLMTLSDSNAATLLSPETASNVAIFISYEEL